MSPDFSSTSSLRARTLTGTAWSFVERYSVQCLQFVVMIVMARLLSPADYGLVGMVAIFSAIAQSLVDCGLSQALIRKLDRSRTDTSTAFYTNLAMGAAAYLLIWLAAPAIADFYRQPQLASVTRVLSLCVIINAAGMVQRAILSASLDFRTMAKASVSAAFLAGIVGISMAYAGYGVWSLVAYQITLAATACSLVWVFSRWRPVPVFSAGSFRALFGFGSRLAAAGLLNTVYENIYTLTIGRVFSPATLGFYSRAEQIGGFFAVNTSHVISRVSYPVMCALQKDADRLRDVSLRIIRVSAFAVFPVMLTIAALSPRIIEGILGAHWLPAAPMLSILTLGLMWFPVHVLNLNLLQVAGRSDLFLRLEIAKKIFGACMLCVCVPLGVTAVCWGSVTNSLVCLVINSYYTRRLIGMGILRQLAAMLPSLAFASIAAAAAFFSSRLLCDSGASPLFALFAGAAASLVAFIASAWLCRSADLRQALLLLRRPTARPALPDPE